MLFVRKAVVKQFVSFTDHSKSRFFDAVDRRKDEIYGNLISEFG